MDHVREARNFGLHGTSFMTDLIKIFAAGIAIMKSKYAIVMALSCLTWQTSYGREWSDATGNHRFEGDLIAASPETAVVRGKHGNLEAYIVDQLSELDQNVIKEYIKAKPEEAAPEKTQTWSGREGLSFQGRVTGYGTKALTVAYASGGIRVNKKPINDIDEIYQTMIPKIVAEFDDDSVKSEKELRLWGRKLRGKEKAFAVDGVMMQLGNGDNIAVPLFMFADEDRRALEAGWDTWKAEDTKDDARKRESFLAEASAAEYQRNREAEANNNRQIQMMQLGMMAVNSGITNVWQVQMLPRQGVRARPMAVMIPATNSAQASAMASQKYPGFAPGAIRQMNY
jgi:hypothetical protein